MDQLGELDSWTAEATTDPDMTDPLDAATVARYQALFECSYEEAIGKIASHQVQLHPHISGARQTTKSKRARGPTAHLVRLYGTLDLQTIVKVASLPAAPELVTGSNDVGELAEFARVNEATKFAILSHFAAGGSSYRPTFLQITQAEKSLCELSAAPMLGQESSLPHFRASRREERFMPEQNQYPVWYFFYGMLADPTELSLILRLSKPPEYRPASMKGGILLSERQLVDAPGQTSSISVVQGFAYLVESARQEDSLRFSVTDKYEVVRCDMELTDSGESVRGLAFRYITSAH